MVKHNNISQRFNSYLQQNISAITSREVRNEVMSCLVEIGSFSMWFAESAVKHTQAYTTYMATLEEPEYYVERILNPIFDDGLKFRVKWQGWDETTNEPLSYIENTIAYGNYLRENDENMQLRLEGYRLFIESMNRAQQN